jgi:predicted transcriptional regulator
MALEVTDAELAVLQALWEHGPSTIRELTDLLYPGGTTSQYATVGKLLERLEHKACVHREQQGRVNSYTALIDRDQLIANRLRATADRLCKGSLTPLLTQLVSSADLTREDLDSLRALVDGLDEKDRG